MDSRACPKPKKHCSSGSAIVKYTRKQKEQAVISLCSRIKPAKEVADDYGTTLENLYNWKRQLLNEGCVEIMTKNKKKAKNNIISEEVSDLCEKKFDLESQVLELQKEVHRLKIERDIYEIAAEIIKKTRALI